MSAAAGASVLEQSVQIDKDGSEAQLNEVVERYAPLVKRIAHHLLLRMPASVQIDDLVQSGMIGRDYSASLWPLFQAVPFGCLLDSMYVLFRRNKENNYVMRRT